MGILDSIKTKLFGKKEAAEPEPAAPEAPEAPAAPKTTSLTEKLAAAGEKLKEVAAEPVDIEMILDAAVKAKGVNLNWRQSIVDLMKALDLDSSLAARKELAADLNYTGPHADGTAEKNIWLHKQLMKTLVECGGKLPKELVK